MQDWTYSHTQLALWKRCKRMYYNSYVLGQKEPKTPAMAAGTWLCQEPIEQLEKLSYVEDNAAMFEACWANFLAEFGGDDSFDSPIYTPELPKLILAAYKKAPVFNKVVEVERRYEITFAAGLTYSSKPDLVAESDDVRTTWDIKLKSFYQKKAGDTWNIKAQLSPFDDQCVGQAVLSGAQRFGQVQFWLGKTDGKVYGPFYVEHTLNPVLAKEWQRETAIECGEIDQWRMINTQLGTPWPKNSAACHDFGRDCYYLPSCLFGFDKGAKEV